MTCQADETLFILTILFGIEKIEERVALNHLCDGFIAPFAFLCAADGFNSYVLIFLPIDSAALAPHNFGAFVAEWVIGSRFEAHVKLFRQHRIIEVVIWGKVEIETKTLKDKNV